MLPTTIWWEPETTIDSLQKIPPECPGFSKADFTTGNGTGVFSQEKRQSFEPQQLEWPNFGEQKML